jgi:glycosyltransferase involved in cell wall biosynthesis
MKVSVVIPAFNEEKLLPATLQAVADSGRAFDALGWQWEVVVCDNNSTDRTAAVAEAAGARVVFEPVNQIARARNRGAEAATGDWLMFVDADSQPTPELFADVAGAIQDPRCVGGGCTLRWSAEVAPWARRAIGYWNWWSRLLRWAAGSFIFCEAKAFRELGGFDLEFYVSEEIDFSRRLKRLARRRGQRVVILTAHPLLTSARKTHLYTLGDHLRFLGRFFFVGRGLSRKREHCFIWYDGRR